MRGLIAQSGKKKEARASFKSGEPEDNGCGNGARPKPDACRLAERP
jgi:hypothetical protein